MKIQKCIDKHNNSIVFQIDDIDSRKKIVTELLEKKYIVSWGKKNKLELNMRNY